MAASYLAIGLMSGTSLDGVDAALVRTDGFLMIQPLAACTINFPPDFREKIMTAATKEVSLIEVLRLEKIFTQHNLEAVHSLLNMPVASGEEMPDVIGFHGQTLRHLPEEGLTFQMGDGSLLAEKTGVPVVSDFRRRDVAAGGEGAPLASLYHAALLSQHQGVHVVLNLGGVANITLIGADGAVVAGDVGPGGGLLDLWMQKYFNQPYDEGGAISLKGHVDEKWLATSIQSDPFFKKPLPKSADRHQFHDCWPAHLSPEASLEASLEDGAATLAALTAQVAVEAISDALNKHMPDAPSDGVTLWLTGGGGKNMAIRRQLEKKFSHVRPIDDIGMSADVLEAACFAWLAVRRLKGLPTSDKHTTGAEKATTGGVLTA